VTAVPLPTRGAPGRGFLRRHRRAVTAAVGAAALAGFIEFVVPQLRALAPTVHRLRGADPKWLGLGVALEALSIGGYIALFRTVFSCEDARIGWKASYQITLAGVVATKLFAAAGAGGVALTVWALRASGLDARTITRRVLAFEFCLYGVYAAAVIVGGVGLRSGLFTGGAPWALTVAPAALGAIAVVALLSMRALPNDFERRMKALGGARRGHRVRARLARAPWAVHDALGITFALIGQRKPGLLGAIAYWAAGRARRCRGRHDRSLPRPRDALQSRDPGRPLLPPHLVLAPDGPGCSRVHPTASYRRPLEGRDQHRKRVVHRSPRSAPGARGRHYAL
jgi:hypothetical protein